MSEPYTAHVAHLRSVEEQLAPPTGNGAGTHEARAALEGFDTAHLLAQLAATVRRFVVVSAEQASVVALWILHAWAIDAADTTPYLAITSAEKRSGKSRLLEVLAQLVPRPIEAANISEAALFRALGAEDGVATLCFDEIDGTFGPKARDKEDLRALVNAGYRRGARAYRCVGEGARQRVEAFPVFGPKALAGIGALPETIADRCVPIRLHRRSRDETVERGRFRTIAEACEPLREAAATWADDASEALRRARPDLPPELDDRAQDGAEPLLAIADLAGAEWSTRARTALVELHCERTTEDDSWGVQLLSDARAAFEHDDRLSTADLLERLRADEEAPWAGWSDGKGLQPRGLAKLLGPYGIRSRTIRQPDGTFPKGYKREQFEDAWRRYLTAPVPLSGAENATPATSALASQERPESETPQRPDVADAKSTANPHPERGVAGVADSESNKGSAA